MSQILLRRFYHGDSMQGTFYPGDLLVLVSATKGDIISGDIIVFQKPESGNSLNQVVHRVISVTEFGLVTRGDHNLKQDTALVPWDKIVGKVIEVESAEKKQKVINGRGGLQLARMRWAVLRVDFEFRRIFRRSYHFLRLSKLVTSFWKPSVQKIYLENEAGMFVKYLHKQQVVATWDPAHQRFDCRKPFDLVIPSPLEEKHSPTHAKLD